MEEENTPIGISNYGLTGIILGNGGTLYLSVDLIGDLTVIAQTIATFGQLVVMIVSFSVLIKKGVLSFRDMKPKK